MLNPICEFKKPLQYISIQIHLQLVRLMRNIHLYYPAKFREDRLEFWI